MATRGSVAPENATIITVDEDWDGGAGNFLGTLYAWKKACQKDASLKEKLKNGASMALFHTAGKGTRLAPLPAAENNNKPGVRLPVPKSLSILESVIKQTGAYANSRGGRLSVFWGDQIFIPSISADYTPRHHADILCALGPMPTAEDWKSKGLDKYGCIAAKEDGSVFKQLEKVSHEEATQQLDGSGVATVGPSLGSFSLSHDFLMALEAEFAKELGSKVGKMDSDPHLWMPLTLSSEEYADLALKKKLFSDKKEADAHRTRVNSILTKFDLGSMGVFGAVDVGTNNSWWDYGQLTLYQQNAMLLTRDTEDAKLMRKFFAVDKRVSDDSSLGECKVDATSVVTQTTTMSGSIASSVTSEVCCKDISADGAVLVGVFAKKIKAAKGSVAYNIVDESEDGLVLGENEVKVGVFSTSSWSLLGGSSHYLEIKSDLATDGGKAWKEKVHGNSDSFEDIYNRNIGIDVSACAEKSLAARQDLKKLLNLPAKEAAEKS